MTYYTFTDGVPVASSRGTSLSIRNEFQQISDGFQLVAAAIAAIGTTNINASLPSQAGKSGRPFITDGTNTKWATQFYIDQAGGNVGIGPYTSAAPPASFFTASKNASALIPAPTLLSVVQLAEADGVALNVTLDSFGTTTIGSGISCRHARGTGATPTATLIGNEISHVYSYGWGATGYSASSRATIQAFAAENWTDIAQGAYWSFSTTPIGSIIPVERLRITDTGALLATGAMDIVGICTNSGNTQPCFEYYKSVADVTAGTGTVKFDTASFTQQGTGYDPATGVFTVPAGQAGFWDIRSQLLKYQEGVETIQNINIKVNGTVVATGSAYASGTTTPKSLAYPFVSRILKLAAGDLVTITTTSIGVGNVAEPGIANSFFSGRLIG